MIGKLLFLAAGLLIGLLLARFLRGGSRGHDLTAPPPARAPLRRVGDERIDDEQIRELIRQNRKIDAIKLMRQKTGLGLAEAKDAVEAMEDAMR